MKKKWIFLAPLAVLGFLLFIAIGAGVVRFLWNWLLPPLFGWQQITFWQALALLALCRILFGSHGFHGPRSRMRDRMRGKMEGMTSEERAQFREKMRARWGFGPGSDESRGHV